VTLLSDIKDYPWKSLLIGLLPVRLAAHLPARFQTKTAQIVPSASIAGAQPLYDSADETLNAECLLFPLQKISCSKVNF
jgi:hypothetical protein